MAERRVFVFRQETSNPDDRALLFEGLVACPRFRSPGELSRLQGRRQRGALLDDDPEGVVPAFGSDIIIV